MSKLFKRVISIVATVLIAAIMATSASADTSTIGPKSFGNGTVKCILSANASNNYCYGAIVYSKSSVSTKPPQIISVEVSINDAFTGECYKSLGPVTKLDATGVSVGAYMWDDVTVTLFGAFSVTYGNETWVEYKQFGPISL